MRAHTAVVLLVALVACGADSTSPDMSLISGDYVLRTINGGALPVTVTNRIDIKLQIAAETLSMKPSGTFSDVTHYIRSDSTGFVDRPADTLGGTWTVQGNVITYTTPKGPFIATVGGSSILIEGNGLAFLYIK